MWQPTSAVGSGDLKTGYPSGLCPRSLGGPGILGVLFLIAACVTMTLKMSDTANLQCDGNTFP